MDKGETLTAADIEGVFGKYEKDDFVKEEEPYTVLAEVLSSLPDELTAQRVINTVQVIAKEAGCPKQTFDMMLKAALKNTRSIAQNTSTGFTGLEDFLAGKHADYGIYMCSDDGIWLYDPANGVNTVVCSHPIFPTKRYKNIETGNELLDISFRRDGIWSTKEMIPRQTVAQARQIVSLSDYGISVTSETAKDMVKYLNMIDDRNRNIIPRIETIGRLGWIQDKGFSPYIEGVEYDNAGKFGDAYSAFHKAGSFDAWLEIMKKVRANRDCRAAQIVSAASVASVILKWTCNQPFIVHVWSTLSGSGKTISMMLAASIWADPTTGRYIKSLNSTSVAFEQMAAFCNNLPLCLDELQTIQKNADFDDIVYMLCEGTGRARSTRNLGVREQTHWLNTIITNGEQPITNDSKGGAINRVISIDTKDQLFQGTQEDMSRIADTLRENYGFAGEMIVKAIAEDPEWPVKINQTYRQLVGILMKTATGKQANYGAALLTADWLIDSLVTHDGNRLMPEDISRYLATPESVDMNRRAKEWLIDFVSSNIGNFWRDGDSEDMDLHRTIYGKRQDDGTVYIIPSVLRTEMRKARYDYTAFLKWCCENDLISTYHNGRGERHWGIPTELPGVGDAVKAICFKPEVFKTVEDKGGMTVVEPEDLPF